jgi:hypothetical protein
MLHLIVISTRQDITLIGIFAVVSPTNFLRNANFDTNNRDFTGQ